MLQGKYSAILSTLIWLLFVIKLFVLSTFEWPFYIGFLLTVASISFCTVSFFVAACSSVDRHLPLVLEVPGSIPARSEENFGVRTRFH